MREPDLRRTDTPIKHEIKQLWQRSHEILNLALLGHKNKDIAKILNIEPQTVSNTLNSQLGKEALSRKREARDEEYENLRDDILDLSKKALNIYHELFGRPDVSDKLKKETADTVMLELSGLRVPTRIDKRSVHATATIEEIEEFKQRGMQAAREAGLLIDEEGDESQG